MDRLRKMTNDTRDDYSVVVAALEKIRGGFGYCCQMCRSHLEVRLATLLRAAVAGRLDKALGLDAEERS